MSTDLTTGPGDQESYLLKGKSDSEQFRLMENTLSSEIADNLPGIETLGS